MGSDKAHSLREGWTPEAQVAWMVGGWEAVAAGMAAGVAAGMAPAGMAPAAAVAAAAAAAAIGA